MGFFGKLMSGVRNIADKAHGAIGKLHGFKEDIKKRYEKDTPDFLKGFVESALNVNVPVIGPLGKALKKGEDILDRAYAKSESVTKSLKDIHAKTGVPPHETAMKVMAAPAKAEEAPPARMEALKTE